MSLSTPLSLPATRHARIVFRAVAVIGEGVSPWTLASDVQDMGGDAWEVDVEYPPLERADAEDLVGFLLACRGKYRTFYLGDPLNTSPRGTWGGSPKVFGAHAAGVTSIDMDGFSEAATVKAGDWFQEGTGSTRHLHKITQAGTANGAGELTIEIFPSTRVALADNATFVTSSPQGVFRLASNVVEWSIERAQRYGIRFTCKEAL